MYKRVVGVRFKKAGRMYYFDPGELPITATDGVLVETTHGVEYADVVLPPSDMPEERIIAPLKGVMRIATQEDHAVHEKNTELEKEAFRICQEKILQHTLEMKLVDVEYSFNGSKVTFFFTSEGRVDFRDLVKDLAFIFKTRIELRQIGVRDEAKMLGGLGSCGRPVCCKTFLTDFQPVSIKMAKEQKLSLSPTKISGLCGRLMCCLKYEQDAYESMRKLMPKINREVITPDGKGMVLDNNAITERTKVRIALSDGTLDVREYHFSEVCKPGAPEEEEGMRKELIKIAKERAVQREVKEEDFRFVTGAERELPAPAQENAQAQEKPENAQRKNTSNRRRPRNKQNAAVHSNAKSAEKKPDPPQDKQSEPQRNAKQRQKPNQAQQGEQQNKPKRTGWRSSRGGKKRSGPENKGESKATE